MGKYGIEYGNDKKKKKVGFGVAKPCPLNLVFQSKEIQGNLFLDKDRVRANDALILSKCIYLNGIDSIASYTGNKTYYIDNINIEYSIDGITFNTHSLGAAKISGLYYKVGNTLYVGYDGLHYFEGYISRCYFTNFNDEIEEIILDFTNAENYNECSFNRAIVDIQPDFVSTKNLLFCSENTLNDTITSYTYEEYIFEIYTENLLFQSYSTIGNEIISGGAANIINFINNDTIITEETIII
jgi:hypothetical protein